MSNTNTTQADLQLAATPNADASSIEKYKFEPIKGYPMLNWRGKRPFTSTQYYPAQLKEVHGDEVDGWRNKIYWGDNLQVMSHLLKEFRGKVDLIYIDPPFDSKTDYKKRIEIKGEVMASYQSSFEEKQYSDIWSKDEYLQFLYERVVLLRELLSNTGVIVIHCDFRKNHHIKCILDEVFGPNSLVNELTWYYTNSGLKAASNKFHQVTDTLLCYSKNDYHIFNRLYKPRADGQNKQAKRKFNPITKKADMVRDEYGNIVYEIKTEVLENSLFQLGMLSNSPEKVGYPTQKPEGLLEKIILAFSNPGAIVFDCFMGSGTTQAVAMKLERRFIGADINLGAIQTTTKRLLKVANQLRQQSLVGETKNYTGFELYNVNHYDIFRNPVQAKELLIEALEIQKLEFNTVFDGEKDGRMVKIMPVNRIATRADLNELIAGFDYKAWERKQNESPNRPVEKVTLVCMGHEPDLAAQLKLEVTPFNIDVEVVDILRDKANLEFKRDSQARVVVKNDELIIERFYPMNLLQKLSLQKEAVEDWRELVESVLIDWNYDGSVLQPAIVDIPGKNELVKGIYQVPEDASTIRVKITDLLSESWEGSVSDGN